MALTDTAIRNAKPGITPAGKETIKPYKMGDTGGLYRNYVAIAQNKTNQHVVAIPKRPRFHASAFFFAG